MASVAVAFTEDMATISLSDAAPKDSGSIRFSFAHDNFELEGTGTFKSDSLDLLASARAHPWLSVKDDEVPDEPARPEATSASSTTSAAAQGTTSAIKETTNS